MKQQWASKKHKKEEVFQAQRGKSYVTPEGREYSFDYRKEGRKYIIILIYRGQRMQVKEPVFNMTPTDTLLEAMENEIGAPS